MELKVELLESNHIPWTDLIRNLGVFLVLLGHISAIPLLHLRVTDPGWMVSNIYNVLARACVPLLFMISGALLLPKQENIGDFYKKRVNRTLLPFLFWSFLYLAAANVFVHSTPIEIAKIAIREIVSKPAEYHLWFMYDLFWIYLFTPVFRVFVRNATDSQLLYFTAVWFLFGPLLKQLETLAGFELNADLGYMTGFVGYFILGYVFNRVVLNRKWLLIAGITYPLCFIFTVWSTYAISLTKPRPDLYYHDLLGWNIVLLSVAAYILLKALGERIFSVPRPQLEKVTSHLSSVMFGVYLIHVFVMRFVKDPSISFIPGLRNIPERYSLSPLDPPLVLTIPILTVIVFLISWAIITLMKKIPYLRALA